MNFGHVMKILSIVLLSMTLAGCSCIEIEKSNCKREEEIEIFDPFEPINRVFFAFNNVIYDCFLFPPVDAYEEFVPEIIRKGISNFTVESYRSVSITNAAIQFDFDKIVEQITSGLINFIFGFAGIVDICEMSGVEKEFIGFSDTLNHYGVHPGFYIVLPIIGPSTVTTSTGMVVDILSNIADINMLYGMAFQKRPFDVRLVTGTIDMIKGYKDTSRTIRATSMDPYVVIRTSFYENTFGVKSEDKKEIKEEKE